MQGLKTKHNKQKTKKTNQKNPPLITTKNLKTPQWAAVQECKIELILFCTFSCAGKEFICS